MADDQTREVNVRDLLDLDPATERLLEDYGFDRIPFAALRERLRSEGPDPERNRLGGVVEPLPAHEIGQLPEPTSEAGIRLAARGRRALERGAVGVVILAGGMATRFGGGAKGIVEVLDGRSFLELKLAQVARAAQGRAPALLMTSFATDRAVREHVAGLAPGCEVRQFAQLISLRLDPDGALFRGADGRPSPYAPGHGDLPFALAASGELARFVDGGGELLVVSNVDNLGASLDPLVIGAHLEGRRPMTVELVDADPGDVGGFPALVGGRPIIVEAFRLPRDQDVDRIPLFNTNTFVFDAAALAGVGELDWFTVRKQVDGRPAMQFERLAGQLTEQLDVNWLAVPRRGARSRFVPIKVPGDLEQSRATLRAVLGAQGVL